MEKETFCVSWDNLVKGTTTVVSVLLISLIVLFSLISDNIIVTGALIILFGSILLIPYVWSPRGYDFSDNTVIVKRLIGDLTIHLHGEPRRWPWTWWGLRLFGSGGFYGYFGLFTFKGIGRVWMHATNRQNLILIEDIDGRKYLLSPDEPERFIQYVRILSENHGSP